MITTFQGSIFVSHAFRSDEQNHAVIMRLGTARISAIDTILADYSHIFSDSYHSHTRYPQQGASMWIIVLENIEKNTVLHHISD